MLTNIIVYSDIELPSITKFEVTLKISFEKVRNNFYNYESNVGLVS